MHVADFIQDHGLPGRLNDLDRFGKKTDVWNADDACTKGRRVDVSWAIKRHSRPQRRFSSLEVHEDIETVLVLGADLHSDRVHLDGSFEAIAEQAPHLR